MILSDIGNIVAAEWLKIEKIRQNVKLDVWVIMSNHLHGIVIINRNSDDNVVLEMTDPVASTLARLIDHKKFLYKFHAIVYINSSKQIIFL